VGAKRGANRIGFSLHAEIKICGWPGRDTEGLWRDSLVGGTARVRTDARAVISSGAVCSAAWSVVNTCSYLPH
jgi:hypothetical protein